MDRLPLATALVSASVFEIHKLYTTHAGPLADAREAPAGDPGTMQRLRDADILTGALVIIVGGTVAKVSRSSTPLWLAVASFSVVAIYYHNACMNNGVGG